MLRSVVNHVLHPVAQSQHHTKPQPSPDLARVEGLWGPAERKAQSLKYQSSSQTRKIIAPTVRIGMPRSHELQSPDLVNDYETARRLNDTRINSVQARFEEKFSH